MFLMDDLCVDVHNNLVNFMVQHRMCSEFLALSCTNKYWNNFIKNHSCAWLVLYKQMGGDRNVMEMSKTTANFIAKDFVRNRSLSINNKIVYRSWCKEYGIIDSILEKSRKFLQVCKSGRIKKSCFMKNFVNEISLDVVKSRKYIEDDILKKQEKLARTLFVERSPQDKSKLECPVCVKNKHPTHKEPLKKYTTNGLVDHVHSKHSLDVEFIDIKKEEK